MGNTLVHFEIPADDVGKLQEFYTSMFDWQIQKYPMEGMDYWGVMTTEEGKPGVNGGMMARMQPGMGISIYFGVDSVTESAAKAQSLGATILVPPSPIPGVGYFAFVQDPQQNVFGIYQDDPNAKA